MDANQIDHLANGALTTLAHYTLQRMQWTRYGQLLLALRYLSLRDFSTTLRRIFKDVIESVMQ